MRITSKDAERFWSRVERPAPDSCWNWLGSTNNTGYGTVCVAGRTRVAHRVAYKLAVDSTLPLEAPKTKSERLFILHRCDNRRCCNPDHLAPGNYSDNQLDCYDKHRRAQPQGSSHANAKLSDNQVREIRTTYAAGDRRQDNLAAKYGVSQRVISLVVRKETYKNVGP